MYEDYSFVLEWNELDDDLKEDKIDLFIKANREEYEQDFYEHNDISNKKKITLEDLYDDDDIRDDAENSIEAHFPIYF